jgi:hypothetical protein
VRNLNIHQDRVPRIGAIRALDRRRRSSVSSPVGATDDDATAFNSYR